MGQAKGTYILQGCCSGAPSCSRGPVRLPQGDKASAEQEAWVQCGRLVTGIAGRHMQGTLRAAMGFTETSRRLQRHHTQGSTNMNLQTCNLDTCGTQNAMQMDTQIAARTQNREDLFMLTKDTHS